MWKWLIPLIFHNGHILAAILTFGDHFEKKIQPKSNKLIQKWTLRPVTDVKLAIIFVKRGHDMLLIPFFINFDHFGGHIKNSFFPYFPRVDFSRLLVCSYRDLIEMYYAKKHSVAIFFTFLIYL